MLIETAVPEIKFAPIQGKILFRDKNKTKIIVKGRRWGLTRGVANYFIVRMIEGTSPILWVDTIYANISKYIERYWLPVLRKLPRETWEWKKRDCMVRIGNSICDFRSADRPENIEGFAYRSIFLNEAGHILKKPYLYYNAILPLKLDHGAEMIVGGTPKGRGLFFELATRAKENPKESFYHFTSYQSIFARKEELEALEKQLPELVKRQEIYAEFLEDEATVFRKFREVAIAKKEEPITGQTYFMGVDLGKHTDYTVIVILNHDGRMVYFDRFHILDWSIQKMRIAEVAKRYNAYVLIDSTGVGDAILDDLRMAGLMVEGFRFNSQNKKILIENLITGFELGQLQIFNDETLLDELAMFEYDFTPGGNIQYSAPEGYHDDCVMALALAFWHYRKFTNESIRVWRIQ